MGAQQARQQLLQLAGEAQAAWRAAGAASTGWQQFECCLYSLNLVWPRQRAQQPQAEAAEEVRQAAAVVAAALQTAAPKLAGTALTLLGGMAEQLVLLLPPAAVQHYARHEHGDVALSRLLSLLLQLLQQPDGKLSRNAATCCHRLTGCRPLAEALAAQHPGWGDALCRCLAAGAGLQQLTQGEELSTGQLLLVSICRLAVAAPQGEAGGSAAAAPSQSLASGCGGGPLPGQLLGQVGAAAEAALQAAGQAPPGSEQQLRALCQAVAQIQAVGLALKAVVGGTGDRLPALLSQLDGMLQHAAAAAGLDGQQHQHGQQAALQQAVCTVAAAVAASPAARAGLELLLGFAATPQHPAVLHTLSRFVCGAGRGGNGLQHLPAAASASLQAAAARLATDADPVWQVAALSLGKACLQHLPEVAAEPAALQALLACLEQGMGSYHREVCEATLPCAEAMLCIGCPRQQGRPCSDSSVVVGGGAATHSLGAALQLQQQVDADGLGAALVLGLLLAAAGSMPPYMMVPVADALFRCWRAAGDARCACGGTHDKGPGGGTGWLGACRWHAALLGTARPSAPLGKPLPLAPC